jgi:hypothetical protein
MNTHKQNIINRRQYIKDVVTKLPKFYPNINTQLKEVIEYIDVLIAKNKKSCG